MHSLTSPLHIPAAIRFECTRCAYCCLSWPVPLNETDVKRLTGALAVSEEQLPLSFLSESERQGGLVGFTRALEKRPDGKCSYLIDSGCSLQNLAKPAMCQLFPYTFMDTPAGTFVGLSFASSGVINNSGKLLSEQATELASTLALFRTLFPQLEKETVAGWRAINMAEGVPLSYESYDQLEISLLNDLQQALARQGMTLTKHGTATAILSRFYKLLADRCPTAIWRENLPGSTARPKQIDQILLASFAAAYVDDSQNHKLLDDRLIAEAVSNFLMSPATGLLLPFAGAKFTMAQLLDSASGPLPPACEDLLVRFIYVRIFSKMYFGPGFSQLSLLAGVGHLVLLLSLARLSIKARLLLLKDTEGPDFKVDDDQILLWLTAIIRQVDSKFASARYGANTRAMLEILFLDRERCARLVNLSW